MTDQKVKSKKLVIVAASVTIIVIICIVAWFLWDKSKKTKKLDKQFVLAQHATKNINNYEPRSVDFVSKVNSPINRELEERKAHFNEHPLLRGVISSKVIEDESNIEMSDSNPNNIDLSNYQSPESGVTMSDISDGLSLTHFKTLTGDEVLPRGYGRPASYMTGEEPEQIDQRYEKLQLGDDDDDIMLKPRVITHKKRMESLEAMRNMKQARDDPLLYSKNQTPMDRMRTLYAANSSGGDHGQFTRAMTDHKTNDGSLQFGITDDYARRMAAGSVQFKSL